MSDDDVSASPGTGRYPSVSTGFKKTQLLVDVSIRGTMTDLLLRKQLLSCYWRPWRELIQRSEGHREQAVALAALHQLTL